MGSFYFVQVLNIMLERKCDPSTKARNNMNSYLNKMSLPEVPKPLHSPSSSSTVTLAKEAPLTGLAGLVDTKRSKSDDNPSM